MPKPIQVTIEVEQSAFGAVFARLDRMAGVISIHLHGRGPMASTTKTPKKGWSPARHKKFKATMARKKRGAKT